MRINVLTPSDRDVAWAAGLFTGEGNVGRSVAKRGSLTFEYLHVQMLMCDRRSITRFAKLFGLTPYKVFVKLRGYYAYRIAARARTAERVLALMWPYLKGTDKGDQAARFARRLRVYPWISGQKTGVRRQRQCHTRGVSHSD